jgi:hypothetical protein
VVKEIYPDAVIGKQRKNSISSLKQSLGARPGFQWDQVHHQIQVLQFKLLSSKIYSQD